jgi:hypothetical protein
MWVGGFRDGDSGGQNCQAEEIRPALSASIAMLELTLGGVSWPLERP